MTHLNVSRHFIKVFLIALRQDDTRNAGSVSSQDLLLDPSNLLHKSFLHINLFTADPVKAYTLPYWSNPPFLSFDIRALWRSVLSLSLIHI